MTLLKRDADAAAEALAGASPGTMALAGELRDQARAPFEEAMALATDPDERTATFARMLLAYGIELALRPMMEATPDDPRFRVQLMKAVVSGEAHFRARAVAWLKNLLPDKTPIPVPDVPTEEPLLPRRVCDHAFWAIRGLAHPDEDLLERLVDERLYDHLPDARKDAVIEASLQTQSWQPAREAYFPPDDER